jgi:hypothetical protein
VRARRQRLDRGDEAVTLTMYCLNGRSIAQPLLYNFPQLGEAAREGGFGDKGVGPALGEEFVFGHHPVTMFEQVEQHLKHLGLKRHKVLHPVPTPQRHRSLSVSSLHAMQRVLPWFISYFQGTNNGALYKQCCHASKYIIRYGKEAETSSPFSS